MRSKPSRYYTIWMSFIGLIFGILLVGIATLIALYTTDQPLTIQGILRIHLITPLLWVIDIFPLLFAVTLGMLGAREDQLAFVRMEERAVQKRAVNLQRRTEVMEKEAQEQQELEEIISRGKKEWEATFDSVEDMILLADESGSVVRCNRATTRAFQAHYLQIIGKPVNELFFGRAGDELERLALQRSESRLPKLEGWYEVTSNSLVSGEIRQGTIYVVRNVTDRKLASLDLQRQKQFYETLVRNSPIAILTLSLDQRIVACNPAFEEMFGYRQSDILGYDLDSLISPADLIEESQALTERVKAGEIVHQVTKRLHKDGSLIDVEVFGIPVVLWGKQIGIFALYHDVSELVKAQEEIIVVPVEEVEVEVVEPEIVEEIAPFELETVEMVDEEVAERPAHRPIKVEVIEGIGPIYAAKLAEAGVITTEDLLNVAGSRKGRKDLAEQTGLSGKLVLKWVNRADLMRVPGVGEEYSDLLEQAGVDTVKELRNRNPENLYQKLLEINEEKNLVRRAPHQSEVEAWIQAAKELETRISY